MARGDQLAAVDARRRPWAAGRERLTLWGVLPEDVSEAVAQRERVRVARARERLQKMAERCQSLLVAEYQIWPLRYQPLQVRHNDPARQRVGCIRAFRGNRLRDQ